MTEPLLPEEDAEEIKRSVRESMTPVPHRRGSVLRNLWLLCLTLGVAAFAVAFFGQRNQVDEAQSDTRHANDAVAALASQVRGLGGVPVASPSAGAKGDTGPQGLAGRGIVASGLTGDHLYLTYTDGSQVDVGRVVGPQGASGSPGRAGTPGASGQPGSAGQNGADGKNGADGRGISSTAIDSSGHLIVTYTDGTTSDLGRVVGSNGKDGTDGKAGADGTAGSPPASFTFTVPGPLGDTTYVCTPDGDAGPGSQPNYTCSQQADSSPTPTPGAS